MVKRTHVKKPNKAHKELGGGDGSGRGRGRGRGAGRGRHKLYQRPSNPTHPRWWVNNAGVEIIESDTELEDMNDISLDDEPEKGFRYAKIKKSSKKKRKNKYKHDDDSNSSGSEGEASPSFHDYDYFPIGPPPIRPVLGLDYGHSVAKAGSQLNIGGSDEVQSDTDFVIDKVGDLSFINVENASREEGRLEFLPYDITIMDEKENGTTIEMKGERERAGPRRKGKGVKVPLCALNGKKKKQKHIVEWDEDSDELSDSVYADFIKNTGGAEAYEGLEGFATTDLGNYYAPIDLSDVSNDDIDIELPASSKRNMRKKNKAYLKKSEKKTRVGGMHAVPPTAIDFVQPVVWNRPTTHGTYYIDPMSVNNPDLPTCRLSRSSSVDSSNLSDPTPSPSDLSSATSLYYHNPYKVDITTNQQEGEEEVVEVRDGEIEGDNMIGQKISQVESGTVSNNEMSTDKDVIARKQLDGLVKDLMTIVQSDESISKAARNKFNRDQLLIDADLPSPPPGFQRRLNTAKSYHRAMNTQDQDLLDDIPAYKKMVKRMGKKSKLPRGSIQSTDTADDLVRPPRPKGGYPGTLRNTHKREKNARRTKAKIVGKGHSHGHSQTIEVHTISGKPIPDSNIGNLMLRNMGWAPGTGLGAERSGIQQPVQATMRPRNLGLGNH